MRCSNSAIPNAFSKTGFVSSEMPTAHPGAGFGELADFRTLSAISTKTVSSGTCPITPIEVEAPKTMKNKPIKRNLRSIFEKLNLIVCRINISVIKLYREIGFWPLLIDSICCPRSRLADASIRILKNSDQTQNQCPRAASNSRSKISINREISSRV